ncbi:nuclear transport factor 2 family protein [Marinobacter caseinilyticus]|uniref:nuclear transport factor 2 family protein n=1 Tax=Marinobacter caseinilyticus TaxID=2692195 RepID=UPI001F2A5399|nr:nuclear transport factor 2 family protein [Marinobacter caseinilyticus]
MVQQQIPPSIQGMPALENTTMERFRVLFNQMSSGHLGALDEVYHGDIVFTDPFTTVTDLTGLREYFTGAYLNVISCQFEFGDAIGEGKDVCLPWVMKLRHKRIRKGELIKVDGISRLVFSDGLIVAHRDYFDAGQLLYENLPVLGTAVRWLRKHAA